MPFHSSSPIIEGQRGSSKKMIALTKILFLYSLLIYATVSQQSRRQLCLQRRWRKCELSPDPRSRNATFSMQQASVRPENHEHNSIHHWQRDSSSAKMEVNQHMQRLVTDVKFHHLLMLLHENLKSVPMPQIRFDPQEANERRLT